MLNAPSDNYIPGSNSVVNIEPTEDLPQEFKYVEPEPPGNMTAGKIILGRNIMVINPFF